MDSINNDATSRKVLGILKDGLIDQFNILNNSLVSRRVVLDQSLSKEKDAKRSEGIKKELRDINSKITSVQKKINQKGMKEYVLQVPQQPNGYDCCAYVCFFAPSFRNNNLKAEGLKILQIKDNNFFVEFRKEIFREIMKNCSGKNLKKISEPF